MSLRRRIKKLEERQRIDESLQLTWEEFLHVCCALDPEGCKRRAKEPGGWELEAILRTPPPPNIDSLVRRMKRLEKHLENRTGQANRPASGDSK